LRRSSNGHRWWRHAIDPFARSEHVFAATFDRRPTDLPFDGQALPMACVVFGPAQSALIRPQAVKRLAAVKRGA